MKIKRIKTNELSPLRFDTLPYETPILFNNFGFYEKLKDKYEENKKKRNIYRAEQILKGAEISDNKLECKDFFVKEFFQNKILNKFLQNTSKWLIPYTYCISKGNDSFRKISITHPFSQLEVCDLYDKYTEQILYSTSKSQFSLRYPEKKAKKLFFKRNGVFKLFESIDLKKDEEDKFNADKFASKYFTYKKYQYLYSFYESTFFISLEKKYKYLCQFDISNCFDSIYTHSIAWAIKGKEHAKKNIDKKNLFENKIDDVMMGSNWRETNGIPIGSEFSRIFAEIILQQIDVNIEKKLEENSIILNNHYVLVRYVDDYFLFTNNNEICKKILNTCKECLSEYLFHINESKTKYYERPFTTHISVLKREIYKQTKVFLTLL